MAPLEVGALFLWPYGGAQRGATPLHQPRRRPFSPALGHRDGLIARPRLPAQWYPLPNRPRVIR